MPNKPLRLCKHVGCKNLVREGYCEQHKKDSRTYDQHRGTAAQRGYDSRWRRIRKIVLAEEPLCRECMLHGIIKPATDVHHIDGDVTNTDRSNLEPLCHECHSRHTAKTQAFGRG